VCSSDLTAIFVVLGGTGLLAYKLITSISDDPLVFLPDEASGVFGMRVGELSKAIPSLSRVFEDSQKASGAPATIGGLSLLDVENEVYISTTRNASGMSTGGMIVVCVPSKPLSTGALSKDLGPSKTLANATVYTGPNGTPGLYYAPSSKMLVIGETDERQFAEYLNRAGRAKPDTDIALWKKRVKDDHVWFLYKPDPNTRTELSNLPIFKELDYRGIVVRGKVNGSSFDLRVGVICRDAAAAQKIAPELKKGVEQMLSGGAIPGLPVPLPPMSAEAKAALRAEASDDFAEVVFPTPIATMEAGLNQAAAMVPMIMKMQQLQQGGGRGGRGGR